METAHGLTKALHIFAFTAWMAGMFYLPRLYAYHAEAGLNSPQGKTFELMERRLLTIIMRPALLATWVLGLLLVFYFGAANIKTDGWLHAKLALVIAMSALHGRFEAWRKRFANGGPVRSPRFYRIANEVPTVLFLGIVLLAVLRPF